VRSQSIGIYTSYQVKLKDPEDKKKSIHFTRFEVLMAALLETHVLYNVVLVTGGVVPDISEEHSAFIFKSQVVKVQEDSS
jgi:hypothetical protein